MAVARLVSLGFQRFWRATRGLSLRVEVAVSDGARVLLITPSADAAPCLPGSRVSAGETVGEAAQRVIGGLGLAAIVGPPRLFWIYGSAGARPGAALALFVADLGPAEQCGQPTPQPLFEAGALPANVDAATRKRINDVLGGRAPDELC